MFYINPTSCKSNVSTFENAQAELKNLSAQIEQVRNDLPMETRSSGSIDAALQSCIDNVLVCSVAMGKLGTALGVICDTYSKTEEGILGKMAKSSDYTNGEKSSAAGGDSGSGESSPDPNTPFDDNGWYGGKQAGPKSATGDERDALYDIVRKYYPEMTDDEIKDYLKKLNDEGCGYVAIANSIFKEFEGKEELFEKKFGFPMVNPDTGELNYNMLVTDLYAATDNHNLHDGFWIFDSDEVNPSEDASATDGWGTTEGSRKYRAELYLKDKGIKCNIDNSIEITPENFHDYDDGSVIMRADHFTLIDEKGNTKYVEGGHAMTVTGVTEDGMLIVSSWGKKYYLDPTAEGCSYSYAYYDYTVKGK